MKIDMIHINFIHSIGSRVISSDIEKHLNAQENCFPRRKRN